MSQKRPNVNVLKTSHRDLMLFCQVTGGATYRPEVCLAVGEADHPSVNQLVYTEPITVLVDVG